MDTIDEEILTFQAIGMRMTEEQINLLIKIERTISRYTNILSQCNRIRTLNYYVLC